VLQTGFPFATGAGAVFDLLTVAEPLVPFLVGSDEAFGRGLTVTCFGATVLGGALTGAVFSGAANFFAGKEGLEGGFVGTSFFTSILSFRLISVAVLQTDDCACLLRM